MTLPGIIIGLPCIAVLAWVWWKADETLGNCEGALRALEAKDPMSRIAAAKVIARFGAAAGAALPLLQANLKEPGLLPVERSDIHAAIAAISGGGRIRR